MEETKLDIKHSWSIKNIVLIWLTLAAINLVLFIIVLALFGGLISAILR